MKLHGINIGGRCRDFTLTFARRNKGCLFDENDPTPTHADPVFAYSTNQRFTDVLQGVRRVFSRRFKPYGVEPRQAVY